jgi:hypothetical protein
MFEHEEETVETLFGQPAEEPGALAPATAVPGTVEGKRGPG